MCLVLCPSSRLGMVRALYGPSRRYDVRVLYLTYISKPPLSRFVELFWFYEGYSQPHAKERIMPDGSMQVVINLLEDEINTYHPNDPDRFDRFSGAILAG